MNPRVSPEGRRIAVEAQGLRIDVLDLQRQTLIRLTPEAPGTSFVIWNRDGSTAVFRRYNTPYWVATDGSGREGRVPGGIPNDYPSGAGPDADSVLMTRVQADTGGDIFLHSLSGAFKPKPLVATRSYEGGAQLSPDGRWLVYVSTESGQFEIQVRRYPALDRKWHVSAGFGVQPRWRADGREIFYRDGQNMAAVPFDGSKQEPSIGVPVALFKDEYDLGQGITIANYDVTKEGRFVMLRTDTKGASLRLVMNWSEELREIIARGGVR
jgi:Tol biopolymer transport system component